MSRNARIHALESLACGWLLALVGPPAASAQTASVGSLLLPDKNAPRARVVVVHDAQATEAFEPRPERLRLMVQRAITNLTGQAAPAAAWRSLVSPKDIVGLKVVSAPGASAGTRPAVVAAVIEGLLAAQVPPAHIIIWDRHRADLRLAGFFALATNYGVRVQGSIEAGWDEGVFYPEDPATISLIGPLIWSDLEYGQTHESVGRRSFYSKLVTKELTKIINITPLLNHNRAGVWGNLYSLALGSADNVVRFESHPARLAQAVPEIYNREVLADRVVLNLVDALICQYQGQQVGHLHYSTALNELRFSTDPVALDVLSLQELDRQRRAAKVEPVAPNLELYQNASLLELGVSDLPNIMVERFQ